MPLNAGLVGAGQRGTLRAEGLAEAADIRFVGIADTEAPRAKRLAERYGTRVFTSVPELLHAVDLLCIAVPTRDHFLLADAAAREGCHVFLEWPPATSLPECETLVELAQEAGIEIGVSSPLLFHPFHDRVPEDWTPTLIHLTYAAGPKTDPPFHLAHTLAAVLDLCCGLVGSRSVQRVDAEAVRGTSPLLDVLALTLRFHRGTYAQLHLRGRAPAPVHTLHLAGDGVQLDVDLLEAEPPSLQTELAAFLTAVTQHRPAPVSVLEAVHTLKLVERVLARLR